MGTWESAFAQRLWQTLVLLFPARTKLYLDMSETRMCRKGLESRGRLFSTVTLLIWAEKEVLHFLHLFTQMCFKVDRFSHQQERLG